ncbi:hypothetical protein L596_010522 [Steinernema carpocapsae]|uniref:C-type lectin domain-containing protein n=1 Tax=Steinernema carpocapsae TaxID=34508 RepID=A0A4U5PIJ3_STECR|nr:hypothetical protein L596_010522 [Steinernema carpocapsae]
MKALLVVLMLPLLFTVTAAHESSHGSVSSKNGSRCFIFMPSQVDFINADAACREIGGNLASILTEDDQQIISELLHGEQERGVDVWIGGNDIFHYGNWSWTDGSPFKFLSNHAPSVAGDCLSLVATTMWTEAECCSEKSFVCVMDSIKPATCPVVTPSPTPSAPPTVVTMPLSSCSKSHCTSAIECGCQSDWTLYLGNNMCYRFFDWAHTDWEVSERYCRGWSGHLVSIRSQEEQHFLEKLVNSESDNDSQNVWIGLSRNHQNLKWSDECPLNYTNWDVHEPSSMQNKECVQMNGGSITGSWSTVPCTEKSQFICKAYPI